MYRPNDCCVVCGEIMPEGYGMVCKTCLARRGIGDGSSANIATLRLLLRMERKAHAETRARLEKADHDRQRYAKRILLVQRENDALKLRNQRLQRFVSNMEEHGGSIRKV